MKKTPEDSVFLGMLLIAIILAEPNLPFTLQIIVAAAGIGAVILHLLRWLSDNSYPKVIFNIFPQLHAPTKSSTMAGGIVQDIFGLLPDSYKNDNEDDYFRQFGVLIITGTLPVSIQTLELINSRRKSIGKISFNPAAPYVLMPESSKIFFLVTQDFESNFNYNDRLRARIKLSGRSFYQMKTFTSKVESVMALEKSFTASHPAPFVIDENIKDDKLIQYAVKYGAIIIPITPKPPEENRSTAQ